MYEPITNILRSDEKKKKKIECEFLAIPLALEYFCLPIFSKIEI